LARPSAWPWTPRPAVGSPTPISRTSAWISLLLLYRIFAEYITYRLRLTNEELIRAKKEVRRLGGDSASQRIRIDDDSSQTWKI
jgi:hypothetical protein